MTMKIPDFIGGWLRFIYIYTLHYMRNLKKRSMQLTFPNDYEKLITL